MKPDALYLDDFGVLCSLGAGKDAVWRAVTGAPSGEPKRGMRQEPVGDREFWLARVDLDALEPRFPPLQDPFDNRVNAILRVVADEIRPAVGRAIARYGAHRVGVMVGSCDNGSEQSLKAFEAFAKTGAFPEGYRLESQRADLPARFLAAELGATGPSMAFSTACSSGASALASARNLIRAGFCDAVIAGGADIVSPPVVLGFAALEAVSPEPCQPFSANRRGITLGEGAALFLLARDDLSGNGIVLAGVGESADAHHMTAPDPAGAGAKLAMRRALSDAALDPADIDYVNLHGTGTKLNDAMESLALAGVFGNPPPASSTKALIGHTLGAAGAIEAGLCWMALSAANPEGKLPPHAWDGEADPENPPLSLVAPGQGAKRLVACLSNSFAFGGCDVSLVIAKAKGVAHG